MIRRASSPGGHPPLELNAPNMFLWDGSAYVNELELLLGGITERVPPRGRMKIQVRGPAWPRFAQPDPGSSVCLTVSASHPAWVCRPAAQPPHTARPVSRELQLILTAISAGASRVASGLLGVHAIAIPRQVGWSLSARLSPSTAAFPVKQLGRLLQLFFRGLLSVHSCYGLHARRVAKRPYLRG